MNRWPTLFGIALHTPEKMENFDPDSNDGVGFFAKLPPPLTLLKHEIRTLYNLETLSNKKLMDSCFKGWGFDSFPQVSNLRMNKFYKWGKKNVQSFGGEF